ncbi:capsular polysaccharide synthesis protein [Methylophaga sp.]|uniref:capsular polysaccharide synthesis protein n=1 Tax=Methylophaga sp. TaxID=2024840 RepID=UPI003F71E08D
MSLKKHLRSIYSFYKWFFDFFIYSPKFEVYVKQLNKINGKYFDIVKDDQAQNTDTHLKSYYSNPVPKIVWIYWAQGEMTAPLVVKKCIESWRKKNTDWEIIVLDAESLTKYIELPKLPEYLPIRYHANLLRTILLKKYGGVWTDATTYCHRPLSEWLPLLSNNGFFMFSNPSEDRDIENWFIASIPNQPLITAWQKNLENYYKNMKKVHPSYFLAFYIYQWMLKQDKNLRRLQRECSSLNAGPCFIMKSVLLGNTRYFELDKHLNNGLPLSKLDWRLNVTDEHFQQILNEIELDKII